MKTKPILFNTEMVKAILEGRKTQTRRIIKGALDHYEFVSLRTLNRVWDSRFENCPNPLKTEAVFINSRPPFNEVTFKSKHQVGDILWVRETFRQAMHYGFDYPFYQYKDLSTSTHCEIIDTDQIRHDDKWTPSIFMPKQACRLWLEVINVRIERLQDISEADAVAEGIQKYGPFGEFKGSIHPTGGSMRFRAYDKASRAFQDLWQDINGEDSWDANPWVWVYTFQKCETPQDFLS